MKLEFRQEDGTQTNNYYKAMERVMNVKREGCIVK